MPASFDRALGSEELETLFFSSCTGAPRAFRKTSARRETSQVAADSRNKAEPHNRHKDPYGRITKVAVDLEADFGFTGFYRHQTSGLSLTMYRAYDPELGRWLSRDPIQEEGGVNLYAYVLNNPVTFIDPLGLDPYLPDPARKPPGWSPSWPTGTDKRGEFSQDPGTGKKWYPSPEDKGHWDHYDGEKRGERYPPNAKKPWPGQKKCNPDQSPNDPWIPPPPKSAFEQWVDDRINTFIHNFKFMIDNLPLS